MGCPRALLRAAEPLEQLALRPLGSRVIAQGRVDLGWARVPRRGSFPGECPFNIHLLNMDFQAGGRRARGWRGAFQGAALRLRLRRAGRRCFAWMAWVERMNRSGTVDGPTEVPPRPPRNPLRRGFDALRKKGYKLVGDIAKLLGVSENTVRRMEAEGVIPKAKRFDLARGKNVRAYSAKDIERIARSKPRERWLAEHPGRWGGSPNFGRTPDGATSPGRYVPIGAETSGSQVRSPYRPRSYPGPVTGLVGTSCLRAIDACPIFSTVTPWL